MTNLQVKELTQWEVQELVYEWFRKITIKEPVEQVLPLLASQGLEMQFPDTTMRSLDEFKKWYYDVTHLFFDQVHDIKFLAVDINGGEAQVNLIVNWQARTWTPPNWASDWQGAYVHQCWTVKRDPSSGRAVIAFYQVKQFDPMKP